MVSGACASIGPMKMSGAGDAERGEVEHHPMLLPAGAYYARVIVRNDGPDDCSYAVDAFGQTVAGTVAAGDDAAQTVDAATIPGVYDFAVSAGCAWSVEVAADE